MARRPRPAPAPVARPRSSRHANAGSAGRSARRSPGAAVERLEGRTLLAAITVTTTADDGPGSLRQAIRDATASLTDHLIEFDIPGAGSVHTIRPLSPLPTLPRGVVIDGTTEPGYAGVPLIELDGSAAGAGADGLSMTSGTARGLIINRFSGNGIVAAQGVILQSNYIGTDATGNVDLGNGGAGVWISLSATIGGARAADGSLGQGNLISGNGAEGIRIAARVAGSPSANVQGNYIGTNASGTAALGNDAEGVLIRNGGLVLIGQIGVGVPGVGNVISGNGASGIRVTADPANGSSSDTRINGNYIGTDATGSRPLGNGASPQAAYRDGITSDTAQLSIGSGFGSTDRNVISANAGAGVHVFTVDSYSNVNLRGNYIGSDAAGAADLGNASHGVWVTTTRGHLPGFIRGNLISGNGGDGVRIDGDDDSVTGSKLILSGNFIGTDVAGAAPLGNDGHGVNILGAVRAAVGDGSGLQHERGGAVRFGTDAANLISANGGSGVNAAYAPPANPDPARGRLEVTVFYNYIGTDAAGRADLGNRGDGVTVDAGGLGLVAARGNLVSGNGGDGIHFANTRFSTNFEGSPVAVGGNFVGTNATGTAPLGNDGDGVELDHCAVIVGSQFVGRNVISGNRGNGIYLTGTRGPVTKADSVQVLDNYVGTDVSGELPLGNGGSGVYIDAAGPHRIGAANAGNVISANGGDGITIVGPYAGAGPDTRGVDVAANRIGNNVRGQSSEALGNRGDGVAIVNSAGNLIGVTAENVITANGGSGISVRGTAAQDNTLSHNTILANHGLGIDLIPDGGAPGVTPNDPLDADAGPNGLQNFPVIQSAVVANGAMLVRVSLDSAPSRQYVIEFFYNPTPGGGDGDGVNYIGSRVITADASGHAEGVFDLLTVAAPGARVTATARLNTGSDPSGTSEFSPAVAATTPPGPATVVGRHVFYNHSAFDADDPGALWNDDYAIAPDKGALLPGAQTTSANVTNYSRGINGLMIDVAGLPPAASRNLTADDFSIYRRVVGADGVPSDSVSRPTQVMVRRGEGVNGSDRITLIWPDYDPAAPSATAAANAWLEVTVKANADTGLASPDVFAFGNLIGDADGSGRVNSLDLGAVKALQNTAAPIDSRVDFNRDGRVNALDLGIVKKYLNRTLAPAVLPPPPAPVLATAAEGPTSLLLEGGQMAS